MHWLIKNWDRTQALPAAFLLLLLAAALALYWPGLNGGLMLDDFENLTPVRDLDAGITTLRDAMTTNASGPLGRPVAMLTFALDQIAHGGDAWYFKYTNLLIHLLTGVLILWLTGRLLRDHSLAPARWWLAIWVAAMWLVTPLQTSTVLYVIQRMAQLAALFVFAGLVSYVIGRQLLDQGRRLGLALVAMTFLLWWPLAALSKENALLLPLFTLLIEVVFFRFHSPSRNNQRTISAIYILLLVIGVAAVFVKVVLNPALVTAHYSVRDFTLTERLLTEARILFAYIQQLVTPHGATMGVYHDDYPKSVGLLSPPTTLLAIAAWTGVLLAAFVTRRTELRFIFFGVLFFLAGHLLESTVFPLELYFEHRNYLPGYGIFLALAMILGYSIRRFSSAKLLIALGVLFPLAHAAATYQRVQTWISYDNMLYAARLAHPQSPRVHGDLSVHYMNNGALSSALKHLEILATLDPKARPATQIQTLVAHCMAEKPIPDQVYRDLEQRLALTKGTYLVSSLRTLAEVTAKGRCAQLDVKRFARIFGTWLQSFDRSKLQHKDIQHYWLMNVFFSQLLGTSGRPAQAFPYLDNAVAVQPDRLEPEFIRIRYQLSLGRHEDAKQTLARLKQMDRGQRNDFTATIAEYDNYLAFLDRERSQKAARPRAQ